MATKAVEAKAAEAKAAEAKAVEAKAAVRAVRTKAAEIKAAEPVQPAAVVAVVAILAVACPVVAACPVPVAVPVAVLAAVDACLAVVELGPMWRTSEATVVAARPCAGLPLVLAVPAHVDAAVCQTTRQAAALAQRMPAVRPQHKVVKAVVTLAVDVAAISTGSYPALACCPFNKVCH